MEEISAEAAGLPDFNVFGWPWTGLVTLAAIALYIVLARLVGRARAKYKVAPPATDGPPEFWRIHRAHLNTGEQLLAFLPLLWIVALSSGDVTAAVLGGVWVFGRLLFVLGYGKQPEKRYPGFMIAMLALAALFLVAGAQLVRSALIWQ